MTRTTLFETIGAAVAFGAIYLPFQLRIVNKAKAFGYQLLADQPQKLHSQGIKNVYLVYSLQSIGIKIPKGTVWSALSTGYVCYLDNGILHILVPKWNIIYEFVNWKPTEKFKLRTTEHPTSFWYKMPGVYIGDRSFIVCGINVTDPKIAKDLLKTTKKRRPTYQSNREQFIAELKQNGFSI